MTDFEGQVLGLVSILNSQFPQLDAETYGIQMFGAPRLNVFFLFGPDERRVTNVLADLLNPDGRHGQDRLFLNTLLRAVDLPETRRGERVSIATDDVTSDGRLIDITVKTEAALLGIEVKLWAAQQQNQLSDYASELETEALKSRRHWKLLFLADQKPETAEDKVVRMPWATPLDGKAKARSVRPLADILIETMPKVRAPRTRALLEEFVDWISQNFGVKAMDNGEYDNYVDAAIDTFSNEKYRRALGSIMLAQSKLHQKVIDAIGGAVFEALKNEISPDFALESTTGLSIALATQYGDWMLRRPHWPENLLLGLSAEGNNFNPIIYGISAPDGSHQKIKDEGENGRPCAVRKQLDTALLSKMRRAKFSAHWPWYDPCPTKKWDANFAGKILLNTPSGDIAKYPEIKSIIEVLVALAHIIDDVVRDPTAFPKDVLGERSA